MRHVGDGLLSPPHQQHHHLHDDDRYNRRPAPAQRYSSSSLAVDRHTVYLTVPSSTTTISHQRSSSTSRSGDLLSTQTVAGTLHPSRRASSSNNSLSLAPPGADLTRTRSLSTSGQQRPAGPVVEEQTYKGVPLFVYAPLNPSVKRAIRLLRVLPDLDERTGWLRCVLRDGTTKDGVVFDKPGERGMMRAGYAALSYTWGGEEGVREVILLNGRVFFVRRNLYAFLRCVRKSTDFRERWLWVDAVCINQEDGEEKGRQVGMMWKIYSETSLVVVWLGGEMRTKCVGYAMKRMGEFAEMNDAEMAVSVVRDEQFWKGFAEINEAMYWDRVWVIQEFTLPERGRIVAGTEWVSFRVFQETIRRFDGRIWRMAVSNLVLGGKRREGFEEYISNIHPLWKRRMKYEEGGGVVDAGWTTLSGSRYCRDLRDRVYGIMPLASHGATLKVDYELTPLELLLESVWLEHDSDMDRTDIVMNLANILLLTPASVCMYADTHTSSAKYVLWKTNLPRSRKEAMKVHLAAASSRKKRDEWLHVASVGGELVKWRNFAADKGALKIGEKFPIFPGRRQCPWQMFVYCDGKAGRFGLKLAVDVDEREGKREKSRDRSRGKSRNRSRARSRDRSRSERERHMSPEEFMDVNRKRASALGVYRTTCAPVKMTVYYALAGGLEGVGPSDNKAGAFEEALEGLGKLDFDL